MMTITIANSFFLSSRSGATGYASAVSANAKTLAEPVAPEILSILNFKTPSYLRAFASWRESIPSFD